MFIFYKTTLWLLLLLLLLVFLNCSYITHGLTSIVSKKYPGAIYYINTDEKLIALTIDDSPDSNFTLGILETLSKYDSKATFFLITDYIAGNEDIVRQIIKEGRALISY